MVPATSSAGMSISKWKPPPASTGSNLHNLVFAITAPEKDSLRLYRCHKERNRQWQVNDGIRNYGCGIVRFD